MLGKRILFDSPSYLFPHLLFTGGTGGGNFRAFIWWEVQVLRHPDLLTESWPEARAKTITSRLIPAVELRWLTRAKAQCERLDG